MSNQPRSVLALGAMYPSWQQTSDWAPSAIKEQQKRHRANETDLHPRKLLHYKTWDCHSHKGRENISNRLKRLKDKFSANSAGFRWPTAKWSSTSAKRQCFPCCHSISLSFGGIAEACQSLHVTASSVLNPCLGKVWIYAVKPKIETGIASGNCLLQKCQQMQKRLRLTKVLCSTGCSHLGQKVLQVTERKITSILSKDGLCTKNEKST